MPVFSPIPTIFAPVATILSPIAQIFFPVTMVFAPIEPVFDAVAFAAVVLAVANVLPAIQPVFAPIATIFAPVADVLAVIAPVFSPVHAILDAICHAAFPLQIRLCGFCGHGARGANPQQCGARGHPDNTPPPASHDVSSLGSVLLELTCTESNTSAAPKLRSPKSGIADRLDAEQGIPSSWKHGVEIELGCGPWSSPSTGTVLPSGFEYVSKIIFDLLSIV